MHSKEFFGNQGKHQNFKPKAKAKKKFFWKKKFEMADLEKSRLSKSPILKIFLQKFRRLVLGLVELIDAKGIDVAQPMWL